jgi:AcrR family transcriptional regulator
MTKPVKRDYRSSLRAAQAQETRRSIVEAAARLFVTEGYGATTIDAVADAAGVSRKTVFTAVGGKLDLLKVAMDWAVAGDDEPIPLAERITMRRLLDQDDPTVLITDWVRMLVGIDTRVAALSRALEVAAGIEPQAAMLVEQSQRQRLDGARLIVKRLIALHALQSGLTRREAVDVAWLATDAALFDRLVLVRGWSTSRFEAWLSAALCGQLLA